MLPELSPLFVPTFSRISDYFGVWAIEASRGMGLWQMCERTNLTMHVNERKGEAAPKLVSTMQVLKVGTGQNVQQIAVVMLRGPLMKAVSSMEEGTSTVQARRDVRKAAADPEVSAILLAIDSPGGTVSGTADLAADVLAASKSKPVWAYADDLCASAAYWIGSQADRLIANTNTALIGSIGTLAVVHDLSGAAEKLGAKVHVIGTGPLKGAGTPGSVVTEEHQGYFRGLVDDGQKSFDAAVQKGRGLTAKQLADVKTGGVFGATEALDLKLIDGIQSLDETLKQLAAEAKRHNRASSTRAAGPIPSRSAAVDETTLNVAATAPATAAMPTVADVLATARGSLVTMQEGATITDPIAAFRQQHAAEIRRVGSIQTLAAKHPAIAAEAIEKGWDAAATELAVMKADLANNVRAFNPAIVSRDHATDCSLQALEGALMLRLGQSLDNPAFQSPRAVALLPEWMRMSVNAERRQQAMEWSHRFRNMSMLDLCREAIRLDMSSGRTSAVNFYNHDDVIRASFSGGSLTNIFTTSVNAILLTTFMQAPDSTGGWTREIDVADFKTQERPRMTKLGGSLPKLPRGSEADHASRSDQVESYKISRYAEQFVVDEQDIIDDALNALSDMPREFGDKAARQRPDLVYAILLANPTLTATARALFNTTDGNLGSGSALASGTLKTAIGAMQLVRENGVNLNLTPTHLIVPTALRFLGRELLQSSTILISQGNTTAGVTERGSMNVLQGENLTLVSDARLENGVVDPDSGTTHSGSASTWFLASNQGPTIEVAYRRGTGRMPQVRPFVLDKGKWGIGWDINLDIGAKAMEWRTMRKTTG